MEERRGVSGRSEGERVGAEVKGREGVGKGEGDAEFSTGEGDGMHDGVMEGKRGREREEGRGKRGTLIMREREERRC